MLLTISPKTALLHINFRLLCFLCKQTSKTLQCAASYKPKNKQTLSKKNCFKKNQMKRKIIADTWKWQRSQKNTAVEVLRNMTSIYSSRLKEDAIFWSRNQAIVSPYSDFFWTIILYSINESSEVSSTTKTICCEFGNFFRHCKQKQTAIKLSLFCGQQWAKLSLTETHKYWLLKNTAHSLKTNT